MFSSTMALTFTFYVSPTKSNPRTTYTILNTSTPSRLNKHPVKPRAQVYSLHINQERTALLRHHPHYPLPSHPYPNSTLPNPYPPLPNPPNPSYPLHIHVLPLTPPSQSLFVIAAYVSPQIAIATVGPRISGNKTRCVSAPAESQFPRVSRQEDGSEDVDDV